MANIEGEISKLMQHAENAVSIYHHSKRKNELVLCLESYAMQLNDFKVFALRMMGRVLTCCIIVFVSKC